MSIQNFNSNHQVGKQIWGENKYAAYLPVMHMCLTAIMNLASEDAHNKTHDELEKQVEIDGREIQRLLFQSHFDERASLPIKSADVVATDGCNCTHLRLQKRKLESIFGVIEVRRIGYGKPGRESLHPFDAGMNLPISLYSYGVQKRACKSAASESFDDVIENIKGQIGVEVAKRQVEEMTQQNACDFEAFYKMRGIETKNKLNNAAGILVLTSDGKGIPMCRVDLREATREAAETRQPALKHRKSKGERTNSKRMGTVVSVYTIAPYVRRAEQIIKELRQAELNQGKDNSAAQDVASNRVNPMQGVAEGERRPHAKDKRVWASIKNSPEIVIGQAFDEAEARDAQQSQHWCVLVDGNAHQLRLMNEIAAKRQKKVTIVLDFIHVTEYLWHSAWALHSERDPQAESWVQKHLLEILRGHSAQVVTALTQDVTRVGLSATQQDTLNTCINYLTKYAAYLHYDEYLSIGLPIASGVIEGACRYVVKDRMEKTGARWRLNSAEAVLQFRSLKASGDFEEYWKFHLECEFQRQHTSKFADGCIPKPAFDFVLPCCSI